MNKAVATLLKRYPKGRWSELARKVGLSQASLSLLMNGKRTPRDSTRTLFEKRADIPAHWWFMSELAKPAKARKR